jgi:hypothetical protein
MPTPTRNPQTMHGMPSAATPDSSMPHENKFTATISCLVRTRDAGSCRTHFRLHPCRNGMSRKLQGICLHRCVWIWLQINKRCVERLLLPLLIPQCRAKTSSLPLFPIQSELGMLDLAELNSDYVNACPCRNGMSRKPQGIRLHRCVWIWLLGKKSTNNAWNAFHCHS